MPSTALVMVASLLLFAQSACGGLLVQAGGGDLHRSLELAKLHLVCRLETDPARVSELQTEIARRGMYGRITVEHWPYASLPFIDNLVNRLEVRGNFNRIDEAELQRVLVPGGRMVRMSADGPTNEWVKPTSADADEWTHQWHDADGGLTTDDRTIGIPSGLQWIHGPLFAMAGRKSSTQSLVSAGGRNFYVTQNVADNIDRADKRQHLVARDAYNGLQLWQRSWEGPFVVGNGETNPRLLASSDVLWIGTHKGVLEIDAATGEAIRQIVLADSPTKILHDGDGLLIQTDRSLVCERDGQRHWTFSDQQIYGTAITEGTALCLVVHRTSSGQIQNELVQIDMATGAENWRTDTGPWAKTRRLQINFAAGDVVGLQSHGHMHVFSLTDGSHLWSRTTDAVPGKTYVDERYVGHFYRHGLIWILLQNSPRESAGQNEWAAFDPQTGEQVRSLRTVGRWPPTATPAKMGCQLLIASDRYIMIPRQATFVDFQTGQKHGFKFVRGGCGLGFVPANGLVYSHPHACGCFSEAVRGFVATHSRPAPKQSSNDEYFVRGPAYGTATLPPHDGPPVWPMYRSSASRGGTINASIPQTLTTRWSATVVTASEAVDSAEWTLRVGNPISAPVISRKRVIVADVQGHRVTCFHRESGSLLWDHFTTGRVDSPPTVYGGLCLFGAHDGTVTCLNATTGEVVWKRSIAPSPERMVAFGQLESPWPVAGSVLIQNGLAFVAAGRAPDADGGIHVSALQPETGAVAWSTLLKDNVIGLADYLVGDGTSVYLANCRIDVQDGSAETLDLDDPHLRGGKAGLLEAAWTKMDLALRKEIQSWTARGVAAQLLSFDDVDTFGYQQAAGEHGVLLATKGNWQRVIGPPAQIHAMAAGANLIAIAGAKKRFGKSTGFLTLIDRHTGEEKLSEPLESPPVFDGLALTSNEIVVSLASGTLQVLGPDGNLREQE